MKTFTAAQETAIVALNDLIACVAGPGSGKTSVLVERVRRLIAQGVAASDIVVLTFTNAAARELEERLVKAAGPLQLGFCGTLHSFALRALRDHGTGLGYGGRLAVIDEDAAAELLASKAKALGCKVPAKRLEEIKAAGRPETTREGPRPSLEQTVVAAYYDDLREAGIVDLDAILPEFLRLLKGFASLPAANRLRMAKAHLLVDETQDSSELDWAIYRAFPAMVKFVVGDPDQAIYGFRGGRQDLFLEFARDPLVRVITLEENFRCGQEVCAAANRLIARNRQRLPKETSPHPLARAGQVDVMLSPHMTEGAEVACVVEAIRAYYTENDGSVAILARSNAIAAPFRDALNGADIMVQAPPRTDVPYDWALARAFVELLAQPDNDTLAFFYVAARARKGGATPAQATERAHAVRLKAGQERKSVNALLFNLPKNPPLDQLGPLLAKEELSAETRALVALRAKNLPAAAGVLELAADMAGKGTAPAEPSEGVHVGTVHGAKGREWDIVYLVGYEDELTPGAVARDSSPGVAQAGIEEERRLAFVGITRARLEVWFSHSAQRRATWGRKDVMKRTPSRFIAEALT